MLLSKETLSFQANTIHRFDPGNEKNKGTVQILELPSQTAKPNEENFIQFD